MSDGRLKQVPPVENRGDCGNTEYPRPTCRRPEVAPVMPSFGCAGYLHVLIYIIFTCREGDYMGSNSINYTVDMAKLSSALKALINSPVARPGTVPAPRNIQSVYQKIQQEALSKNLSQPSWLAVSVR